MSAVVGRRRHHTGKVAWYAINTSAAEFSTSDAIHQLYFDRWLVQEHVYHDGSGAIGLDVHQGYGKKKINNIAVLDKLEKPQGRARRLAAKKARHENQLAPLREQLSEWEETIGVLESEVAEFGASLTRALDSGANTGAELAEAFQTYQTYECWLAEARRESTTTQQAIAFATQGSTKCEAKELRRVEDQRRLERRRHIFTVDVELDDVLTAFKLTFMNLCSVLMTDYLGIRMELETLIDAMLTLPGEQVLSPAVETVQIFRPKRNARTMAAVERACIALTERGLARNGRVLRFELKPRAGPCDPKNP